MAVTNTLPAVDTFVTAARPLGNYYTSKRLGLKASDPAQYIYMTFSILFPMGATITDAELTFYTQGELPAGTHTIYVAPLSSKPLAYSLINYDNRPSLDVGRRLSITKEGPLPSQTKWTLDISDIMNEVSSGEHPWFGLALTTPTTSQVWVYSTQQTTINAKGPQLTVRYADEPDAPDTLTPNEGVVGEAKPAIGFNYVDYGGNTDLSKVHIQASTTNSFAVPLWEQEVPTLRPVVRLDETTFPGASVGQRIYYRVKACDGDGLWSEWSPSAWFEYIPQQPTTLITPNPADPKFFDSSPQITWSTQGTQTAWQVTIARLDRPMEVLWHSGKVPGTATGVEIPKGNLRWDDTWYRLVLRTWDDEDRVSTPGGLPYNYVVAEVYLDEDAAHTRVTNVQSQQVGSTPDVLITWEREAAADAYEIIRHQDVGNLRWIVDRVDHQELVQPDGSYKYVDRTAPPETLSRWYVRPINNDRRGPGAATPWAQYRTGGVWLTSSDGTQLMMAGAEGGDWDLPENTTAHQVIGAPAPIVIRELHQGYSSTMQVILVEESHFTPGVSAAARRDLFLRFKTGLPDTRLVAGDQNIPVILADMKVSRTPHRQSSYTASFQFWQDGEIWWEDPR